MSSTASIISTRRSPNRSISLPNCGAKNMPMTEAIRWSEAMVDTGLSKMLISTQGPKVMKICFRAPKRMFSR